MSGPTPLPDPLEAAASAFRSMPVPEPPPTEELIAQLNAESAPVSHLPFPNRRRTLMRLATLSAAAALLAGGVLFFAAPTAPALADVVKAAEKHTLVKYKMTETSEPEDGKGPTAGTATSVSYADLRTPRFRTERKTLTLNDAVESTYYTVQDSAKGRVLRVLREVAVEGADRDPIKAKALEGVTLPRLEASLSPVPVTANAGFLENLRALESHEDATSTREQVDGKQAIRYVVEDGPRTTTLWVDATTKLPVRMKMVQLGNGKLTVELSNFEWDPKLTGVKNPNELFDLTPPPGYQLNDETKGK